MTRQLLHMVIAVAFRSESFATVRACERLQAEMDAEVVVHVADLGEFDPTVLELALVDRVEAACQ